MNLMVMMPGSKYQTEKFSLSLEIVKEKDFLGFPVCVLLIAGGLTATMMMTTVKKGTKMKVSQEKYEKEENCN